MSSCVCNKRNKLNACIIKSTIKIQSRSSCFGTYLANVVSWLPFMRQMAQGILINVSLNTIGSRLVFVIINLHLVMGHLRMAISASATFSLRVVRQFQKCITWDKPLQQRFNVSRCGICHLDPSINSRFM